MTITASTALRATLDAGWVDLAAAGPTAPISIADGGAEALTCGVTIVPPSDA